MTTAVESRFPAWLRGSRLSIGAKLTYGVLILLALTDKPDGPQQSLVRLSQASLARLTSASVRSVQRYLGELADAGLVAISREVFQGQRLCAYALLEQNMDEQDSGQ